MLTLVPKRSATVPRVEVVDCAAAFDELRTEWTQLLASSKADCLFLTWEWLRTWWRHLSEDRQLRILTVRAGGELVGIAPFAVAPRLRFGHPLETLEFLGSGFAGSDYLDIVAREGREDTVVRALADYLRNSAYSLRLTNVRTDCLARELAARLHGLRWTFQDTQINICPYIPLAGMTWESYLGSLGAEHRYSFRRKCQRLGRDYSVQWSSPRNTGECRESIDIAIALHEMRWSERSDAFHTPALGAFHRDFVPTAFDLGWLRLYVLRLNDKPAACLYGFLYHGKFYFYQSGFDPFYAKQSVGLVTMGLAIRDAIGDGASEFDLLHGNETYKTHWAPVSRDLKRLELFPASALGRISHKSVAIIRNVRRMALGVLNTGQ